MGDTVDHSKLSKSPKPDSVMTQKREYKKSLIASRPKCFVALRYQQLVSLVHGDFGTSAVGRITFFVLKVAALEIVRRFSRNRCPFVWKGLQALQLLCYPPLKWIQRWAPFKGSVQSMQVLSRPLLALSIATIFSDLSDCSDGNSDCVIDSHDLVTCSDSSNVQPDINPSQCLTEIEIVDPEYWFTQFKQELEKEGISLPERINDDELRRFYTASNNDFSCFLTSIKKTIRWRETYRILTEEELKMWLKIVFWHGFDVMHRPCLIIRLGLACSALGSEDRPRFSQAVVSQVEYGLLHLLDADISRITVLVDCEGLSPSIIPMQMMRYCCSLLQDHFPDRLGCLFVIRLPAVVNVTAQTFIQGLKPETRKKLIIEGDMGQSVLSDYLPRLPSYLGGYCACMRCSEFRNSDMLQGTSRMEVEDVSDNEHSPSLHLPNELEGQVCDRYDQLLRTAVIGVLIFWVFIALGVVIYDAASTHFMPL